MMELTMILDTQSVHLASEINKMAAESGIMNGAAALGKGIGAIMLLFVVFYYASAILDGGKFQLKMLWPLVIFICAANFSIISKPVLSFTGAISGGIANSAASGGASLQEIANKTSRAASDNAGHVTMEEHMGEVLDQMREVDLESYHVNTHIPVKQRGMPTKVYESKSSKDGSYTTVMEFAEGSPITRHTKNSLIEKGRTDEADYSDMSSLSRVLQDFYDKTIKKSWTQLWADILYAISDEQLDNNSINGNLFILIVAALLKFFVNIFALVMTAFGSIMTTIFIAFGPLIWGFAVFPGMGKNIGSWLIRLCQFALYGPVTIFIKNLSLSLLTIWGAETYTTATGMSFVGNCAAFVCAIFMLANVPSICSMIIEGAQGSASLSGGYHAMQGALSTALTGGVVGQAIERYRNLGEKGRDEDQLNVLNDINKSINNLNKPNPNGNANNPNP